MYNLSSSGIKPSSEQAQASAELKFYHSKTDQILLTL